MVKTKSRKINVKTIPKNYDPDEWLVASSVTVNESWKGDLKNVKVDGCVLVTTPQAVAVGDVRREVTFCKKAKLKILGIVENMSGFVCPNCKDCTNIFSKGGGKALAEMVKCPFLGEIPIDPNLALAAEKGQNFVQEFQASQAALAFASIIQKLSCNSMNCLN